MQEEKKQTKTKTFAEVIKELTDLVSGEGTFGKSKKQNKRQAAEKKCEELEGLYQAEVSEKHTVQAENKQLEKKNAELKAQNAEINAQNAELNAQVLEVNTKNTLLEEQKTEFKNIAQARIQEAEILKTQVNQLEGEVKQKEEVLARYRALPEPPLASSSSDWVEVDLGHEQKHNAPLSVFTADDRAIVQARIENYLKKLGLEEIEDQNSQLVGYEGLDALHEEARAQKEAFNGTFVVELARPDSDHLRAHYRHVTPAGDTETLDDSPAHILQYAKGEGEGHPALPVLNVDGHFYRLNRLPPETRWCPGRFAIACDGLPLDQQSNCVRKGTCSY